MTYPARRLSGLLFLVFGIASAAAIADPNDYILDLDFTAGERELEAKMGVASATRDGQPAAQAIALAWGGAMSNAWLTEVYGQFANHVDGSPGGGLDSLSWENVVRFADPGEYAVDTGATFEVERSRVAAQGWKVTVGPLLQKDFDQVQVNANLLLSRAFDAAAASPLETSYQFQVKYRAQPLFEPGIQAMGLLHRAAEGGTAVPRNHRMGPALFGRYRVGPGRSVKYNAALLFGLSDGAAAHTVRAQLEYEF